MGEVMTCLDLPGWRITIYILLFRWVWWTALFTYSAFVVAAFVANLLM